MPAETNAHHGLVPGAKVTRVDLLQLVHRTCGITCEPYTWRAFLNLDNCTIAPYGQSSIHDNQSINAREGRDEPNTAGYFVLRVVFFIV